MTRKFEGLLTMARIALRQGMLGLAGALGASAVAAAAAHGPLASALAMQTSYFQLFHATALALAAVTPLPIWGHKMLAIPFPLGIFCFSGGIYSLAWFGVSWGGLIPLGGSLLILAWLGFLVADLKAHFLALDPSERRGSQILDRCSLSGGRSLS